MSGQNQVESLQLQDAAIEPELLEQVREQSCSKPLCSAVDETNKEATFAQSNWENQNFKLQCSDSSSVLLKEEEDVALLSATHRSAKSFEFDGNGGGNKSNGEFSSHTSEESTYSEQTQNTHKVISADDNEKKAELINLSHSDKAEKQAVSAPVDLFVNLVDGAGNFV